MKLLAIDPGGKRQGWALLSEGSKKAGKIQYLTSGILGLERDINYQSYRLRLIEYWVTQTKRLIYDYDPDVVVSEIVPPRGGSIPAVINRQLALSVITTMQAIAYDFGLEIYQLGATTVKKAIGGEGMASKVKVRNGVLSRLPELEHRRPEWTGKEAVFDEVDAIAIGLTYLS